MRWFHVTGKYFLINNCSKLNKALNLSICSACQANFTLINVVGIQSRWSSIRLIYDPLTVIMNNTSPRTMAQAGFHFWDKRYLGWELLNFKGLEENPPIVGKFLDFGLVEKSKSLSHANFAIILEKLKVFWVKSKFPFYFPNFFFATIWRL